LKQSILLTLCALACSTALAQAPAGVVKNPPAESDPIASKGTPADKAQMNVDARKAKDAGMAPMTGAAGSMSMNRMDMKSMDTNSDGMVSKKEWQDHYNVMWTRMKPKNGSLSVSETQGK